MGYGTRRVEFLGHGIGLEIAENPVIARGFDEPLQEGMVIALEPKKGIRGIGMVGTENTFLVTASLRGKEYYRGPFRPDPCRVALPTLRW
jgi:Xaa-Pro aminopeptidase